MTFDAKAAAERVELEHEIELRLRRGWRQENNQRIEELERILDRQPSVGGE